MTTYTRDDLDDMLEVTNAYADESLGTTGINALLRAQRDFDARAELHVALHGVPMTAGKEAAFLRLITYLIDIAGNADDDLYH